MRRVRFPCAICGVKVNKASIRRDHIKPVVGMTGFPKLLNGEDDWNTYIKSLFVKTEEIQMICVTCHDTKTLKENKSRKSLTKKKKRV